MTMKISSTIYLDDADEEDEKTRRVPLAEERGDEVTGESRVTEALQTAVHSMYYIELHCISGTVHCNFHHINAFQCIALHYSVLYYIALHCIALQKLPRSLVIS